MSALTPVRVRPIEEADHEAWQRLFHAYGIFYNEDFGDDVMHRVWAWLMDPDHEVACFVAEVDGFVVGIANYRVLADTFTGGPSWYLDDLYTDSSTRGRGVATALIEALAEAARVNGANTLRWMTAQDNATAQSVYDKVATRTTWVTYEKDLA